MGFIELFIIAVGLSMDALAISICKGLSVQKLRKKHILSVALWFGGSQAVMPLIGYFLGTSFETYIQNFDHWIAFLLLVLIGLGMIKESREKEKKVDSSFSAKVMFPLAVADSIDALASGVTFAFLNVNIIPAVILIFITTALLSAAGIVIGNRFGEKHRSKAEIIGGLILILMGVKILLEHLGII